MLEHTFCKSETAQQQQHEMHEVRQVQSANLAVELDAATRQLAATNIEAWSDIFSVRNVQVPYSQSLLIGATGVFDKRWL